jgi:citrate synthase
MCSEENIRLGRPKQLYVGDREKKYVDIEKRKIVQINLM